MLGLFLLLCFGLPKGPVPVTDWAVTKDASKGIFDAVILEERTQVDEGQILRYRRVRVLSDLGKNAAMISEPKEQIQDLKGRVVDLAGNETHFNFDDMIETLSFRVKRTRWELMHLIPPQMTDNCVVEMAWKVPYRCGVSDDYDAYQVEVDEPYAVLNKLFIYNITNRCKYTREILPTADPSLFQHSSSNASSTTSFLNIPARRMFPYGQEGRSDHNLAWSCAPAMPGYHTAPNDFWAKMVTLVQNQLEGERPPKDFATWAQEASANLPDDKVEAMAHLVRKLRERFLCSALLPADKAHVFEPQSSREKRFIDLKKVVKKGYGDERSLAALFYHLLKESKLPFLLVYPTDVNDANFEYHNMKPDEFNWSLPLFAIQQEDQLIPFAPFDYAYQPGFYNSNFEGMPAMVVTPGKVWTYDITQLPAKPASFNRMITQYETEIDSQGQVHIRVRRQCSGEYDQDRRRHYYPLTQAECNHALRQDWDRLSRYETLSSLVSGADVLDTGITETVTLRRRDPLVQTPVISFRPFPLSLPSLNAFANWPTDRDQDIFLPFAKHHTDQNVIKVPTGWRLKGNNTWSQKNEVGEVHFSAFQVGTKITVRRELVVYQSRLARTLEPALKTYIAWMEESMYQAVGLERPSEPG